MGEPVIGPITRFEFMATTAHSARTTGPVSYARSGGETDNIALGPCLVEQIDPRRVDIIVQG